jgi:hypothetical protein
MIARKLIREPLWHGPEGPSAKNRAVFQRPRFTAFFNSAPAENLVTFFAAIFKG